jgi:hypothetical protein
MKSQEQKTAVNLNIQERVLLENGIQTLLELQKKGTASVLGYYTDAEGQEQTMEMPIDQVISSWQQILQSQG